MSNPPIAGQLLEERSEMLVAFTERDDDRAAGTCHLAGGSR